MFVFTEGQNIIVFTDNTDSSQIREVIISICKYSLLNQEKSKYDRKGEKLHFDEKKKRPP